MNNFPPDDKDLKQSKEQGVRPFESGFGTPPRDKEETKGHSLSDIEQPLSPLSIQRPPDMSQAVIESLDATITAHERVLKDIKKLTGS